MYFDSSVLSNDFNPRWKGLVVGDNGFDLLAEDRLALVLIPDTLMQNNHF